MKSLTANFKCPKYSESHEIFVGTHIGTIKKLNPAIEPYFSCQNLPQDALQKSGKVTAIEFANEEKTEILIGKDNKYAQLFNCENNSFSSIELSEKPVAGLMKYNDVLIAAFENGKIEKINGETKTGKIMFSSGDHISKMRQNPFELNIFATGGKGRKNNLKIFDINTEKQIFSSKNICNDFLQLEVPIWDSDVGFLNTTNIAVCSRYGYLRVYDIRKQRRPVLMHSNENEMKFSTIAVKENHIFCGSTVGELKAYDIRNLKKHLHTYKGCTGSVTNLSLDNNGKHIFSTSLDRYVRIYNVESCSLLYQSYIKSKPTCILVR